MKFKHLSPNSIANTRAKLNMSQSQFAELLGISKSAVGLAEIGRRNLPAAVRDRYAALKAKLDAKEMDISTPLINSRSKPKALKFKK
jgi:transcriptional regulator with XRE-family HTH domain